MSTSPMSSPITAAQIREEIRLWEDRVAKSGSTPQPCGDEDIVSLNGEGVDIFLATPTHPQPGSPLETIAVAIPEGPDSEWYQAHVTYKVYPNRVERVLGERGRRMQETSIVGDQLKSHRVNLANGLLPKTTELLDQWNIHY